MGGVEDSLCGTRRTSALANTAALVAVLTIDCIKDVASTQARSPASPVKLTLHEEHSFFSVNICWRESHEGSFERGRAILYPNRKTFYTLMLEMF